MIPVTGTRHTRSFTRSAAVLVGLLALLGAPVVRSQTPAFPGALGFGQYATGGRGGTVYHVTTLADSGTGSFRDAVSQPNRIIVFDVGGTITLDSAVSCASSLTIAGQTAPGGGIAIIGHEISLSVRTNIIMRYLRVRPGSIASSTEDGINMGDGTNMIFDHVSIEFAPYNNIDAVGSDANSDLITVQNSILADPIGQQFNAHTEALTHNFSWFYNILSSAHDRNPLAKINTIFINNVVYNFQAGYTVADTSGSFSHDIINNYFITGPSTTDASDVFFQMDANQSIYSSGNVLDSNNNGALDGSATAPGSVVVLSSPWSALTPGIPTYSPTAAYRNAISFSGALPRDQVDQSVVSDVTSLGTSGQMWTSQSATGLGNNGYGVINGGVAPIETSGDGMPDYWKLAVGLNPNVNYPLTNAADGYALLEHYLNWLAAPHALTVTNTPVSIDLWPYTGGFTNASPVAILSGTSNGVVTLNNGHIAIFTPAANFSGLGSFQFTVTANDGSSYTNVVNVLMSPITPPANLTWVGDGVANVWTNGGPLNWSNGSNLVAFASGDNVTFDDTGSNTPPMNLSGPIVAGTVYVIADNQDYTFGGSGYLSGGSALFKTGAGQLTLLTANTFAGGTTINEGVVQLGDGLSVNGSLTGNLTNDDTLVYANPGTLTSSVNLAGYGALFKNSAGALTLSGTHTFTGSVEVDAGSLQFSGTVPPCDISNNASLVFAPSGSCLYTNVISGPGTLTTSGSGLTLLAGSNTFAGGVTNTAGFLVLSNRTAAGTGPVTYTGGYVVAAAGMVLTNDFYVPGTSANDLNLMATNTGTGTWAGNVYVGGSAQWRPGSDGGTLEFLGNAVMGSHIFIVPRGGMTFASNAVVSSTVSGYLGRDSSGIKRSSSITLRDNASVAMAGCDIGGGKVGSYVTITLQDNAVLSLGASLNVQDIANSAATTTLRLNGGTLMVGGFTKTQTSYTNIFDFNGGGLQASAANAAFLPAFNQQTCLVQAGGAILNDGGFAITIAAPLVHDPALGTTADGGLTKWGTGTLTLSGVNTYNGATFINAGTLALVGGATAATIGSTTNIFIAAGAVLDVTGQTLGGTIAWQSLTGNGSVNGNLSIVNAILSPGNNAIGTLTFNNSLTFASGSTNLFKISHSPLTNDSVIVLGMLTNGGTLIVTNIGGTPLAAGDMFQLFNAASYSGTFSNVQLPPLTGGLTWNINALNTAGTISVIQSATPVIGSISILGGSLVFSGTGGVGNASFILLGSTNLATPVSNWTPLLTNQFDGSGNFDFTNPINPGSPQSFYRLQVP